MKTADLLSFEQISAIERLYQKDETFLIARMGTGKTVITLSAMMALLAAKLNTRFLIIAPLKVCSNVWAKEHLEWEDLKDLRVGVVEANDISRQRIFGHIEDYDIVVVNYEQLPYMELHKHFKLFDGLCLDEGSKVGLGGKYFKLIRRHLGKFTWRAVLTGTPASEGMVKLFYQVFACDNGRTFGRNKQAWLDKFFYSTDRERRKWTPHPHMFDELMSLIAPLTHVVEDSNYVLPPLVIQPHTVELPPAARKAYVSMATKMSFEDVEAVSAGVKVGKLQQASAGFLYSADEVVELHQEKMRYLEKLISPLDDENGKSATTKHLIVYQFDEEARRLEEAYPDLVVMPKDAVDTIDAWNRGEIRLLAIHSRSSSHGINLQHSGCRSIIWLTPIFSNDQFEQTNARIHRRGIEKPVVVHLILAQDTVDDCVIVPRLEGKQKWMPLFVAHLRALEEENAPRKAYPH